MEMVRLGSTGLKVSKICFGTMTFGSSQWRDWVLDEDASQPFYRRAIEAGINFFDTADMYSQGASEEVLGRALKAFGVDRAHAVIASKCGLQMGPSPNQTGLSRKHILHSIEGTLKRLGTDYVDLFQIHRFDYDTPIEETIEALHDIVKAGKARYIGASSMHTWQFANYLHKADTMGMTRFCAMQNFWNLTYREEERDMIPFCRDEGIALIPWSPLSRGFLARPHAHALEQNSARAKSDKVFSLRYGEADIEILRRVEETASSRGVGNAQVALAWLMAQPGLTAPICGASKLSHLEDAVAAASLILTAQEIAYLSEPYRPKAVVGHR